MRLLKRLINFYWQRPEEPKSVKRPVAAMDTQRVSAVVMDHLDAVLSAYSPPVRQDTPHNEVMWNAGAQQALRQLRSRLEKSQ